MEGWGKCLSQIRMSGLADTWMTPHEQYGGIICGFSSCFITSEVSLLLQLYWILLTFYPETPEVFCGLKHFTHPSISIVVSR